MAKSARQHRHKARILAMQAIFQYDAREGIKPDIAELSSFNWMDYAVPDEEREYARGIIRAALENLAEIDHLITDRLVDWEFSRISPVSRAILRTGVAQLLYMAKEADAPVVIDECVQLAKKYDESQSAAFVNGILDNITRAEKPGEIPVAKTPKLKEKIKIRKPVTVKKSNQV